MNKERAEGRTNGIKGKEGKENNGEEKKPIKYFSSQSVILLDSSGSG
jgi:hypothetical protein